MKDKIIKDQANSVFDLITSTFLPGSDRIHVYGKNVICVTDTKGFPNPNNSSRIEIVIDSSAGFIPLWDKDVTLNWRFNKDFERYFRNPVAAKSAFKNLFGEAILRWKDACPVKFSENEDIWDFEISMTSDNCNNFGCVLASAFFPHQGRDNLMIYPKMFTQPQNEQIETLVHELGHIFGLRHFFASISEKKWASEIFGAHNAFSIMNYGKKSFLTDDDVKDLKSLYELVWSGNLNEINGTKIKKFRSYHMSV